MRRLFTALIVGAILAGAVYGATATLGGIGNSDLGADDAVVASCDSDGVTVDWTVAYAGGGIRVTNVHVHDIANACVGLVLDLFVVKASVQLAGGTATVLAGVPNDNTADVSLGAGAPLAEDVDAVHISIH